MVHIEYLLGRLPPGVSRSLGLLKAKQEARALRVQRGHRAASPPLLVRFSGSLATRFVARGNFLGMENVWTKIGKSIFFNF